jgi:hypothetical protein
MTSTTHSSVALAAEIAAGPAHAATSVSADGTAPATSVPRPCDDCAKAAARRHHGFMADCRGCCARAAARMPQYREAQKAGVQTHAYRRLLEQFGLTHDAVRAAAQADMASQCA